MAMTEQHDDGGDNSRWGSSGWDKSAWAEASREDAESGSAEPGNAEPGNAEPGNAEPARAESDSADWGNAEPGSPAGDAGAAGEAGAVRSSSPAGDTGAVRSSSAAVGKPARPGQDRRQTRPRQAAPGSDMVSDFQRWLLRTGAKSMRKEISGQVRRTFGGSRTGTSDIWDTATTEIPPEVGESPECQWCPICRAARRMRESGPSVGDHLSTASDVVATAVQDALGALDSVLSRTAGKDGKQPPRDAWAADDADWAATRDSWAAAHGGFVAEHPRAPAPDPSAGPGSEGARDADRQTEGPDEPDNRG